ncbi:SDR family NAD(P)-dependent oxidoreductase [Aminivibrio sp.]|uniref:SDR family NAD(P)-dependent oxidoreductase n=1 Tax=Aminivibrio sp. TaxID=1872489 RepID=UPI003D99B419
MKCMNSRDANPFSLSGKKILVTGASSGIGKAIAKAISTVGGDVVLIARTRGKLESVLAELEGDSHRISAIDLLSRECELESSLNLLLDEVGPIDGLVHSAGSFGFSALRSFSYGEADRFFHLNHNVFLVLSKILAKRKSEKKEARSFIAIASAAGLKGNPGLTLYSASKAALISTVRCLALEYAQRNIRFNCICPGWVDTPMLEVAKEMLGDTIFRENIVNSHPLGLGTPEDVANAAVFLLSKASRWITGSSLVIDGGYSI